MKKSSVRSNLNLNTTNRPATSTQSLNATASSTNPNSTLNVTNLGGLVPKPVATDWGLECDFANSEYFRAVLAKDITEVAKEHHMEMIDMQLAEQFDILQKLRMEKTKLEHKLIELRALKEIKKRFGYLEEVYGKLMEIVKTFEVDKNLKCYISCLEDQRNLLRLKNIKKFETQEDYNKFQQTLEKCIESMKKFKVVIGNIENAKSLGNNIEKFISLRDKFMKKHKEINDLHVNVGLSLFKSISDKFANVQGCDKE